MLPQRQRHCLLACLLLLLDLVSIQSFSPSSIPIYQKRIDIKKSIVPLDDAIAFRPSRRPRQIYMSNEDQEETSTSTSAKDDAVANKPLDMEEPPTSELIKGVQQIFLFLAEAYSFLITFASGLAVSGLLLNLFGYGYTLSREDGMHMHINIDTIEHLRMENQMKREYIRLGKAAEGTTSSTTVMSMTRPALPPPPPPSKLSQ